MRRIVMLMLSFLIVLPLCAQTHDETAIKQVINQLFAGMRKSDSAMVRNTFTKEVTMATVVRNKQQQPVLVRESSLDGFLAAIASPKNEPWHEEIWNVKVSVDGDFAAAWCDYAFYVGRTFSHCGIDAFHLHKTNDGWKIFHIADTRRKEGCDVPREIEAKYK